MQIAQKNFYKKLLGRAGEVKAVNLLKKKGLQIIGKNCKTHFGEVDIVAKDGDTVVFVEVKTRSDESYGVGAEAVTKKKQERYFKIASEYLLINGLSDANCRFDVVEINNGQINHIINAFYM